MRTANAAITLVAGLSLSLVSTNIAHSASYSQLKAKGYNTSKMVRAASGSWGWNVTKGADRYFCFSSGGIVRAGKGYAVFGTSGRLIPMDGKAYEQKIPGGLRNIPSLADLKAGRPPASKVGRCQRVPSS